MARITIPLSAVEVKNSKPKDLKSHKLFDGGGLFLLVKNTGSKLWQFKYRFDGKEKQISFGKYPSVSLSVAREKRLQARQLLDQGIDPSKARSNEKEKRKQENERTFKKVALEWQENQTTLAKSTKKLHTNRFERDIFPSIGDMPISHLKPKQILDSVLRPMENRGVGEMTARVKNIISQVCRFAVSSGYLDHDPTVDLAGALKKVDHGHRAAIIEPSELARLLRDIDNYEGKPITKHALQLLPIFFTHPGNIRSMRWSEIDFNTKEWRYIDVKYKKPMIAPIPEQALKILNTLHQITGKRKLCFPSVQSATREMSDMTLTTAFRRMGYDGETVSPSGFRATFRTIADEVLNERFDHMEHQLGHVVRDANGVAYNRTTHLKARGQMMQRWANYLDELKAGVKVIPINRNGTDKL